MEIQILQVEHCFRRVLYYNKSLMADSKFRFRIKETLIVRHPDNLAKPPPHSRIHVHLHMYSVGNLRLPALTGMTGPELRTVECFFLFFNPIPPLATLGREHKKQACVGSS